jgi:AcrR family transcriptional regulator
MATAKERRRTDPEGRRQAILEAGLIIFAAEGFAAAKLDDIALEAGVAKGTIYLYFRDKQTLFEEIVHGAVSPILARLEDASRQSAFSFDELVSGLFQSFREEILRTNRKEILRLVIREGGRFPEIAKFYHREVVSKGLALIGRAAERAYAVGELSSENLAKFPHLVFAPLLMALVWDGLFSRLDPLDADGLLAAHRDILFGRHKPDGSAS